MNIEACSFEKYSTIVKVPFSIFDSIEFNSLNKNKVTEIHYLLFKDTKYRFGIIFGVTDRIAKAPFSAPFSCLSLCTSDSRILAYSEFIKLIDNYFKEKNISKIRFTLPPSIYNEDHISKISNALYINGFNIAGCDLNYHYNLSYFTDQYEMDIDPKARQKLRAAQRLNLSFVKTDDLASVYNIIYENRKQKGYPLWMSIQDLIQTCKVVPVDLFLIKSVDLNIAAAIIYRNKDKFVQVIYWGNAPHTDQYKSMNFLAFKVFEYYKKLDVEIIDIGPSTEFSIPNLGLCDFKQGIGCHVTTKLSYEKVLN